MFSVIPYTFALRLYSSLPYFILPRQKPVSSPKKTFYSGAFVPTESLTTVNVMRTSERSHPLWECGQLIRGGSSLKRVTRPSPEAVNCPQFLSELSLVGGEVPTYAVF